MQLEISNVFNGCIVQRLFDEVVEFTDMVGVGINGVGGEIADSHILGESLGEVSRTFVVRCHTGSGKLDKPLLQRKVRSVKRDA